MIKHLFTKAKAVDIFRMMSGLDWNSVIEEIQSWPDGVRGYLTLHKEGKVKSLEQLGYYYAVILPKAFEAFKKREDIELRIYLGDDKVVRLPLTMDAVDKFFKLNYALYHGEYKDKGDMNMEECSLFEGYVVKWLYHIDCHIPIADKNWKKNRKEP